MRRACPYREENRGPGKEVQENKLQRELDRGPGIRERDMNVRGTLERLTPVLMTALSAGLALTPLLLGADKPGSEILHPVAVTIFGGLISSTLLDAFLTPLLFLKFGARPLEHLRAGRSASVPDGTPAEAY